MKNTFGNNIAFTLFGESHGEKIGVVIDGLPAGLKIDPDFIVSQLSLRKPQGAISTARTEEDTPEIVSGVFDNHSTGTPLTILISNRNIRSKDYSATRFLARPGHADYTAYQKYHGYEDYRGGGHFSGRLTAPVVAAGAILISALKQKGIQIGTHISRCRNICDSDFSDYEKQIGLLNERLFAVLDETKEEEMKKVILEAAERKDSVGGILETAVIGLPAGLGEPWFDSLESLLSHALFAIPGVKGVEFGDGFAMAEHYGSEMNDAFRMKDGRAETKTNHNGGINGGISNGMPIVFKTAVKPTPSIYQPQDTIDFKEGKDALIELAGRHDPAIFPRARVVVDSLAALVIMDALMARYGSEYFVQ